MTRTSRILFAAVALLLTGLFTGLGLWQWDRHQQRQQENARREAQLRKPVVQLPAETGPRDSLAGRRAAATGRFDYRREVVLAPRSYQGTPGVYLLTPLRVSDSLAVPVLRGAMPAPDGFHAEIARARPDPEAAGDTVTVRGVALPPPEVEPVTDPDTLRTAGGVYRVFPRLDLAGIQEGLPYALAGVYLRADSTTERIPPSDGIRVPEPVGPGDRGSGPHLMYALQWFAFAVIALGGGAIFLWRSRG